MTQDGPRPLVRARRALDKLAWGVRAAGPRATLVGCARLLRLHVLRPAHSVVSVRSGFQLGFSYPDQVPGALVAFGDLIDPEYPFLEAIHQDTWTVADVGAAIGQFTVFAALLPSARVYAYEPSVANLATLRQNLERNGVSDRVRVLPVALSDHDGHAAFTTAAHTWVSGLSESPDAEGEMVAVRTLAAELELQDVERLDVLKVNVAGYEPQVLLGAEPVLAAGRVDILVLLLGLDSLPHYARLHEMGYRFFFFHPRHREFHEVTTLDESMLDCRPWPARHVIAVHESAVRRLGVDRFRIVAATRNSGR